MLVMIRIAKPFLLLLGCILFLPQCKQEKAGAPAPPKVEVVKPQVEKLEVKKDFVGQIYGAADIPIRARVDGFLEDILFREGSRVKKGQLLYIIDPLPSKQEVSASRSSYEEARAALIQAENDYERIKPLADINAVSKSDLDAAIANREAAAKRVDAAKANLNLSEINLSYTEIRAPIDGVIGKTGAKVGEYVGGSINATVLNTVSRIDSVLVEFFLTEEDYLEIRRDLIERQKQDSMDAEASRRSPIPLELILADGIFFNQSGRVKFLDRGVDPTTGTILIQAEFPNPDRLLRPGQFAKLRVTMEVIEDAVMIPYRCLVQTQNVTSVKLVDESGIVSIRPITIGAVQGDKVMVKEGLTGDEKLVFTGLQMAKDGMPVEAELVKFESQRDN